MVPIAALWMPIAVAAVLVFLASSVLHMVLTYHRADYKKLPNEDETLAGLRKASLTPGVYFFPYCGTPKDAQTPEMQAKYQSGPVGLMTILRSEAPKMGKYLGLWFVFILVVSIFVAYLAGRTLPASAHYLAVFRVAGATAFLAYSLGQLPESIWKGQPWSNTLRGMLDGLIYALVTAGAFGWLWPR